MINSNDSLFDEMTKEMKQTQPKQYDTGTRKVTQNPDYLLDLHSKKDAIDGLLLLSNENNSAELIEDIDMEIDNTALLPVDAPKIQDFTLEMSNKEKEKEKTLNQTSRQKTDGKKASGNKNSNQTNKIEKSHRKSLRSHGAPEKDTEMSSSDTSKTPKSPTGRLIITRHRLKKTRAYSPKRKMMKCTACKQEFGDKDELKVHQKHDHESSVCVICNKSFSTKRSLKKHSYTHLEKTIKCLKCDQLFSFNSELKAYSVKHTQTLKFKCDIVGCDKEYYRKSELTTHMVIHGGKKLKCLEKNCKYKHNNKRYIKQHMKNHSNDLLYTC